MYSTGALLWRIAKRELEDMLSNKRVLFSILMFVIIWGVIAGPRFVQFGAGISETGMFYMATVLSIYVVMIVSSQAFVNEKRGGRIEVLLCTPVDLRTFWSGKVAGVVVPGYIAGIVVTAILTVASSVISGAPGGTGVVIPAAPLLFYVFIALPVMLAAFGGLLGFIQLFFGMRENRIFNLVIFILIFGLLGAAGALAGGGGMISWRAVGTVLAGACILFIIDLYLTRFLNKEKIITSLG
jgi:ABC-2 type transport system permease protein